MNVNPINPASFPTPIAEASPPVRQYDERKIYQRARRTQTHASRFSFPSLQSSKRKKLCAVSFRQKTYKRVKSSSLDSRSGLPFYRVPKGANGTPSIAPKKIVKVEHPYFFGASTVKYLKKAAQVLWIFYQIAEFFTKIVKISYKFLTDIAIVSLKIIKDFNIFQVTSRTRVYYRINEHYYAANGRLCRSKQTIVRPRSVSFSTAEDLGLLTNKPMKSSA